MNDFAFTRNEYCSKIRIGCDVDWLKTNPGITNYFKSLNSGFSVAKAFKTRGFDHVRIRVTEYDLEVIHPSSRMNMLEMMNFVIMDCIHNDLTPILAFQGQKFKECPDTNTEFQMILWWDTVADSLIHFGSQLAFNLLIETTDAVRNNPQVLNKLYGKLYETISLIDPERILIVPPCTISAPERLKDLVIPGEKCFAESHFYAAGISPSVPVRLWTTGTEYERSLVKFKIDTIVKWREQTGIPVWIGAIMCADFNADDDSNDLTSSYTIEQQTEFAMFLVSELNDAKVPFALNSDTKFYNRETNEWRTEQETILDTIFTNGLKK